MYLHNFYHCKILLSVFAISVSIFYFLGEFFKISVEATTRNANITIFAFKKCSASASRAKLGSACRSTTFFKCKNGDIGVACGCFNGNLEEFAKKVKDTHGDSKYAKEYLAMIEVVKIHFEWEDNDDNERGV